MVIFSEIDKKILITSIVIVVVILFIAFVTNKYTLSLQPKVNNLTGGAQTEVQ